MILKELRYVLAIREHQNISQAAQSLYISQPALSKYIKNLETLLNVKLFHRVGNKMILTYAGEMYIQASKIMLETYDRMTMDIFASDEMLKGKLRIGITTYRGSHLLPKVLPTFLQIYPNVDIIIYEENATKLEQLLSEGSADIVIIKDPFSTNNMESIPIYEEELLLSVPANFDVIEKAVTIPGQKYPWLDIQLVKDECFVLMKSAQRTRQVSDRILQEANITPKKMIETNNIETALRMSAAGLGVSLIPELYATSNYFFDMPRFFSAGNPRITSTFNIAYRKDGYLTKYAKKFIQIVVDYYNEQKNQPELPPVSPLSADPDSAPGAATKTETHE